MYIVLKEKADDKKLPDLLARLNADGYAEVHYKGWFDAFALFRLYTFMLDVLKSFLPGHAHTHIFSGMKL